MNAKTNSSRRHGMKGTRFYRIWQGMKTRCLNPKHTWYKHYGGRGIKVCDEWLSFQNFMNDMYPSYIKHCESFGELNTTLERIDSNQGYRLTNCTWATKLEQSRNIRNPVTIKYKGVEKPLFEWADELGITYSNLYQRIFIRKISIERAFSKNPDLRTNRIHNLKGSKT